MHRSLEELTIARCPGCPLPALVLVARGGAIGGTLTMKNAAVMVVADQGSQVATLRAACQGARCSRTASR